MAWVMGLFRQGLGLTLAWFALVELIFPIFLRLGAAMIGMNGKGIIQTTDGFGGGKNGD
ncbi:hypothetical protein SKTS_18350 [Sulfurimicrobium lacus]|uniref:Uncharacterized protein n=1 Tax=Sulfurimicrobium lacus TaxID=2715678 RepID=A0A6F8VDY7_9PROT|nr:hypothetical protein SKTS_18350 [Sulfurimicrobium lacus]